MTDQQTRVGVDEDVICPDCGYDEQVCRCDDFRSQEAQMRLLAEIENWADWP